ncbi:hypothetical protein L218DRAFT_886853, partial [Marasmius fiardii PR-910]
MSSSTLKLVHRLPMLLEDGGNWTTYRAHIENHAVSKGLQRHLIGMAKQPEHTIEMGSDGRWYKAGEAHLLALLNDAMEKIEDAWDKYHKKEAQTREFIYKTIPNSIFVQIRDIPSAAEIWRKLISICEDRGLLIAVDLLTKLENIRYTDGENVRTHLTKMTKLREKLAQVGQPINDIIFVSNITCSFSSS